MNHNQSEQMTMNPALNISPAYGALAVDKAPAVAARQPEFTKSVTEDESSAWMQPPGWFTRFVLEIILGALILFYLFGGVALAVELLLHTFSR